MRTFVHVQNFFFGPAFSADHRRLLTITAFTSFHTTFFWCYTSDRGRLPTFPPERYGVTGPLVSHTHTSHRHTQTQTHTLFLKSLFLSLSLPISSLSLFLSLSLRLSW